MENNKSKKKYYQYYKNNLYNNKHKKYYYNKNKKNNKKDNIIINNDYIENDNYNNVLNVNEDLNYNEYNGLFNRERNINNNSIIENNINNIDNNINMDNNLNNNYSNNNYNNSDIDLDNILVRRDSIKEDNNINSDNNIYNDVNNNYSDINNSYVEEPIKEENNINNDNVILDLDNILVKKDHSNEKEENKITYDSLVNVEKEEEPLEKKSLIIRTKLGYALGVFIIVIALFGSTYAFFNYYKEDTRQADIQAGEVYVRVVENNLNLSLTKQYPRTKEEARGRNDNYIDFNLVGKNTSLTKVLGYKFTLLHGDDVNGKNRINDNYILFDLAELDGSNNETLLLDGVTLSGFNSANISNFKIPVNQTTELQRKYRLRAWISEDVTISDDPSENATYTQTQFSNLFANFKVHVSSQDKMPDYGHDTVRKAINAKINAETNSCNPIWVDDMGTTNDESDDITYFSGTNECVDMNYVWYSGKLWRITAIYPDGSMKLVTQNSITSIAFNEAYKVNFYTDENTTSYVYQWLNEDFYDTLYNAEEFIDTTKKWNAANSNASSEAGISARLPEATMVSANVGLLNSYEYYNSYRCIGSSNCTGTSYSTGYLNIGYRWWLLNPYSTLYIWGVGQDGFGYNTSVSGTYCGRPSIYLKSGIEFTGNGTIDSPYKIVGDKDTGNTNDLINTRISGEYIKLKNGNNEQTFRIIGVEDGKTKIIAMDYADSKGARKFATSSSDTLWGSGTTTGTDTWYTYLNGTYYPNLVSIYGNLFDSSTYYLGTSGINYKLSVCANTTSGSIKNCIETSQLGTHDAFNIGLPRYGEMFATQQGTGYSSSIYMWLMNRNRTSGVWYLHDYGTGNYSNPTYTLGGRPTLHLKSSVKIISGTGTESDPYIVGL